MMSAFVGSLGLNGIVPRITNHVLLTQLSGQFVLLSGPHFFILLVSLVITSCIIVVGGFYRLEIKETRLNVERILNNFSDIFAGLEATAEDWASWDASYTLVADGNQLFIDDKVVTKNAQ